MARTHFKTKHYVRAADGYNIVEGKYDYFVVVSDYPEWYCAARTYDEKLADAEPVYRELFIVARKELEARGKKR